MLWLCIGIYLWAALTLAPLLHEGNPVLRAVILIVIWPTLLPVKIAYELAKPHIDK